MAPEHEDRTAWGSRILGDARSESSRVEALATGGTLPEGPWSTCLYFEALCKHMLCARAGCMRPDVSSSSCAWAARSICTRVHAHRWPAWSSLRPLIVHVAPGARTWAQLAGAPAGLLATHLPRLRGERSQWHRASASHFGSTPLRRRWQGQSTGAGGSFA